ncbi:MAG: type II toxin-antitoxin system YafQ family toxin [Oscillospiraceae bacterium]|nr:type II toxin-antitoxin system YafQ family toxin [Oscillospiraceae bacterium]
MNKKYELVYSAQYRRDYKTAKKRGYNISLLDIVIELLEAGESLPEKYRDHALTGNYAGHRECHITGDWLLIYKIQEDILILTMTRTGTHSDLF